MTKSAYREKLDCPECESLQAELMYKTALAERYEKELNVFKDKRREKIRRVGLLVLEALLALGAVGIVVGLCFRACAPEISETTLADGSKGAVVECAAPGINPGIECLAIQAGKACPEGYTVLQQGPGYFILSCTKNNEALKAQYNP